MLITVLVVLGSSYLFFILFAWQCADRIIFAVPEPSYTAGGEFLTVDADDGVPLTCLGLEAHDARKIVLYLHGNGEDLGDILPHLEVMREKGVSVFSFDYRGYGRTPGRPTEAILCRDVRAIYRHVLREGTFAPEQVVIYGRSLGSGPAVFLAASETVGGLILEGAFTSAFRVATQIPILPMDRFRNLAQLPAVRCPVLVLHAVHDRTVPFVHGRQLFAAANEPKRHHWFQEVRHNDFTKEPGDEYWTVLLAFLHDLETGMGRPKASS